MDLSFESYFLSHIADKLKLNLEFLFTLQASVEGNWSHKSLFGN